MPSNYHKYECTGQHITLLLKPTPSVPDHFQCPVCTMQTIYKGDILVKGTGQLAHGYYSSYAHGCRCDKCKEANKIYQRSRARGDQYRITDGGVKTYREKAHDDLVKYMEKT